MVLGAGIFELLVRLMTQTSSINKQDEAAKFLERDFNQCFQQMRHYDGQIVDICKFAFTGYIAVAGAALALYRYGIENAADYRLPAASILVLASFFGLLLLGLVVRNRVYFVLVTRYVNEHRGFFLRQTPLGFANVSRMYTHSTQPPYFSWLSSQAWLMYILCLLNAAICSLSLIVVGYEKGWPVKCYVISGGVLFVGQLVVSIRYLLTREQKSAAQSVWGKG